MRVWLWLTAIIWRQTDYCTAGEQRKVGWIHCEMKTAGFVIKFQQQEFLKSVLYSNLVLRIDKASG